MQTIFWATLVVCAYTTAQDAQQFVKSVKGVHSNYQYKGGDTTRYFGYNNNTTNYNSPYGSTPQPQAPGINFETGVCYKEVPTASLARDPAHIPVGNGSRSDLSRIRTCCPGYKRNIYNFLICEPACSKECVNGLCTAPETCSCFPDHVKNLAGFCVATCPIGCQNGHCAGGECLCKEGYKLDLDGKFCIPSCKSNCGGFGNCTAPNTCECKSGYQTSPDGSCKVPCDHCTNGECVEPNVCRCRPGYTLKNGICEPQCYQNCGPTGRCVAPNVCSSPSNANQNPGQQMHLYPPSPKPILNHNNSSTFLPSTETSTSNPNNPIPSYSHQIPVSPQYPGYPGYSNSFNYTQPPNYPLYPGSQVTTKPSSYGHQPQYPTNHFERVPNNQFAQIPTNQFPENSSGINQGSYNPQYPITQNFNFSSPNQYPFIPGNQFGPSQNTDQSGNNYSQHSSNYPYPRGQQIPNQTQQNEFSPYPRPTNIQPNNPQQGDFRPGQGTYGYNQGNQSPNQPQQNEYSPSYPNSQRPNSTSYHQSEYPQPANSRPNYSQQGYRPGQETYGYNQMNQFDQSHESAPLCTDGCINSVCVGHNQCKCNPGYIQDDDDPTGKRCEPYCPGGCPNGYCSVPYTCACNEGYYKDTSVKGRAICIKRNR